MKGSNTVDGVECIVRINKQDSYSVGILKYAWYAQLLCIHHLVQHRLAEAQQPSRCLDQLIAIHVALAMSLLGTSHTPIGLTPGHLSRGISRQATKAINPSGFTSVVEIISMHKHPAAQHHGCVQLHSGCQAYALCYVKLCYVITLVKLEPCTNGRAKPAPLLVILTAVIMICYFCY